MPITRAPVGPFRAAESSPTVGAFEYAYSAVANGAASMGYEWIRDQLERPSAPPKVTGPRSVDQSRGPLPAELLDAFDEADRRYIDELDRMARLAQNEQIAAASDENLQRQLQIAAVNDSIDHLGENDRAIIAATLRQQYYERVQRVQAAARASHRGHAASRQAAAG